MRLGMPLAFVGCRTNGLSDYWVVGLMGRRTNGPSDYWEDPVLLLKKIRL